MGSCQRDGLLSTLSDNVNTLTEKIAWNLRSHIPELTNSFDKGTFDRVPHDLSKSQANQSCLLLSFSYHPIAGLVHLF